jgi:hypothetical protein
VVVYKEVELLEVYKEVELVVAYKEVGLVVAYMVAVFEAVLLF